MHSELCAVGKLLPSTQREGERTKWEINFLVLSPFLSISISEISCGVTTDGPSSTGEKEEEIFVGGVVDGVLNVQAERRNSRP